VNGSVAVDSSALIAILNRETEMPRFLEALEGSHPVVGWPTIFEVRIWCLRRVGNLFQPWLESWLDHQDTTLMSFNGVLERVAAEAYERFGKGRHPAALNFGDCMTYAVARHSAAPLLFKGSDFAKTDLAIHPASVS
jgi:ribonuclease VapC